jgi:uncharacterized protein YutE (UPF0331/DUF86 family)
MDERTERRILTKAEYVGEAVAILAEKRDNLDFETYRANREERDVVEREFQTAIEACIDIGRMILTNKAETVPETNPAVFERLGAIGVLDDDLATQMSRAAGFRNVLAHRYGNEIDDQDVFNVLQTELPAFRQYLTEIRSYLA